MPTEFLRYFHNEMPHDFHAETLHDRFRGALLGLSLAPAVLCAGKDGLTLPMLKVAAPKLLRYHDSGERRWGEICSSEAFMTTQGFVNPAATVQALILGDLLEVLLCDRPELSDFTHLAGRSMRYDLPTEQQQYYRNFAEILRDRLSLLTLPSASMPSTFADDAFVGGLVSALRHLESYALSVQTAAEYDGIAPAIAGFLAGATGGVSSLPVLWQIRGGRGRGGELNRSKVMAIADDLFADWSGIQRPVVSQQLCIS